MCVHGTHIYCILFCCVHYIERNNTFMKMFPINMISWIVILIVATTSLFTVAELSKVNESGTTVESLGKYGHSKLPENRILFLLNLWNRISRIDHIFSFESLKNGILKTFLESPLKSHYILLTSYISETIDSIHIIVLYFNFQKNRCFFLGLSRSR